MRRTSLQLPLGIAITLFLTSISAAVTIGGRVMNRSTGLPSAGDGVVLYRVDQSMHEMQRTTSDAQGNFRFDSQERSHYLIAVAHEGVSYHSTAMTVPNHFEVAVFDSASALKDVHVNSDTQFFEAKATSLNVTEFFLVSNQSSPPRTLSANETYRFSLPRHATLSSVMVQPPETLPLEVDVSHRAADGQFAIHYPIRPGITKIRVVYSLPYSGRISIAPRTLYPLGVVALMVPESMELTGSFPGMFAFKGKHDGISEYSRSSVRPGASMGFILSGRDTNQDRRVRIASLISLAGSTGPVPDTATIIIGGPAAMTQSPPTNAHGKGGRFIESLIAVIVALIWSTAAIVGRMAASCRSNRRLEAR